MSRRRRAWAIRHRRHWESRYLDYDNDGWPDLLFSNDTQPNKLYRNNGNGTFTEKAVVAGIAFSEDGVARAGMGVDATDYDRSGARQHADHEFFQPDAVAVSQRGKGSVRR